MESERRVISSALWAAYGDALGFITELADERLVRQRLGGGSLPVATTRPWKRRLGGQFGATIELPAGCYSDDTQLRLSTSRAIRGSGEFDIEAFAKVELPVWLTYQLGGGRGTKAAAAALMKRGVSWMGNFYEKPSQYTDAGGNGAAMRIQPHVWAAKDWKEPRTYLRDVIRNSIVTHGHPRGFVGAALHALLLAYALSHDTIPDPSQWDDVLHELHSISEIVISDEELGTFWLPAWERATRTSLASAVDGVVDECRLDLEILREASSSRDWNYAHLVRRIGGFTPEHRGSGTKSSLLALALAWQYRRDAQSAVEVAANCLDSDTDTVATLAGALVGVLDLSTPPGPLADKEYIASEATRVFRSRSEDVESFRYPNLMKWEPPASASAAVGTVDEDRVGVAGLGYAQIVSDVFLARGKTQGSWQWLELDFGQRILARVRDPLPHLAATALPPAFATPRGRTSVPQADLFHGDPGPRRAQRKVDSPSSSDTGSSDRRSPALDQLSLDEATDLVVGSGFDPRLIGELTLIFAEKPNGLELTIAFAAVVAKARIARLKRPSGSGGSGHLRNPPPPPPNPRVSPPAGVSQTLPLD